MMNVSVCIPTYNNLDLFKRCLASVLIQDFKDYEIIISDDSTNDLIEDYIKTLHLPNCFYVHNAAPFGSPGNWNNVMNMATGKYVKILHHDDYFTDKFSLGKFIHALETSGKTFAFSYTKIVYRIDNSTFIHKQTTRQIKRIKKQPEFLFFRNVIGAPSAVCFKNDKTTLFNTEYKWLVDVEFYLSYFKKNPGFVVIPEPLVSVVAGEEGQITQSVSKDPAVVIAENLSLFSVVHASGYNTRKSSLFFQELFVEYGIESFAQLSSEYKIPGNIRHLMEGVFVAVKKNKGLKKFIKRILTSRYNKRFFQMERF
ncbi:MAG: glycosyltransferase family 2 protein [Bacteroidetes bacterium]|nr:glycosyltransferase family 2 protein [Bacteroidota bacterium]